jgi:hypothetical protein
LTWVLENHAEALKRANTLKGKVLAKFNAESLYEGFCNAIVEADPVEQLIDLEAML